MCPRGEFVTIQFYASTVATASTVALYDGQNRARTLAANETLLIFSMTGHADQAAGRVDMFVSSTSTVAAGSRLFSFEQAGYLIGGPEGRECPVGITPKVIAQAGGDVTLTGIGGIIAESSTTRPTWKEALTP